MRRLLIVLGVLVLGLINIAANGTTQENVIAIVSIVGAILPLLYKYVPAAGHWMVAITVGVSIVGSVLAELFSGQLSLNSLQNADASSLYWVAMGIYGTSQFFYALLSQSKKTENAVT